MGQHRPLFNLFSSSQSNNTIFTTNKCERMSSPSSIRHRDSNRWPLKHELSPITTRPELPSFVYLIVLCIIIIIIINFQLLAWSFKLHHPVNIDRVWLLRKPQQPKNHPLLDLWTFPPKWSRRKPVNQVFGKLESWNFAKPDWRNCFELNRMSCLSRLRFWRNYFLRSAKFCNCQQQQQHRSKSRCWLVVLKDKLWMGYLLEDVRIGSRLLKQYIGRLVFCF